MEDLIYFLFFFVFVFANLLIKNKAALKKFFESPSENESRSEKNYIYEEDYNETLSNIDDKYLESSESLQKIELNSDDEEYAYLRPNTENRTKNSFISLKKEKLKEAFILKEILDLPLALR
jgi:hypothetical protein